MITVKLKGGLGNQMFQYAIGRLLAIKNKTSLALDTSFLLDRTSRKDVIFRDFDLDIFNLESTISVVKLPQYIDPVSKFSKALFLLKLKLDSRYVKEKHFQFDSKVLNLPNDVYLDGQWTSEKYFKDIEDVIRKDFIFKDDVLPPSKKLADEITSSESICVNVRRGDFVSNEITKQFHGVMEPDYFDKASALISEKVQAPHFFVFSDDIEWCKENLHFGNSVTFVDHEHKGPKFANYLHLMTLCKHFVIPNSTFGWWAAWLSEYKEKIIIAPDKWFANTSVDTSDVIPQSWIKL